MYTSIFEMVVLRVTVHQGPEGILLPFKLNFQLITSDFDSKWYSVIFMGSMEVISLDLQSLERVGRNI